MSSSADEGSSSFDSTGGRGKNIRKGSIVREGKGKGDDDDDDDGGGGGGGG